MKLFRSDIVENLWLALGTLRANKLRSFLTVIGVIIGVVTVMLIASIIAGVDTAVTKEVESFVRARCTSANTIQGFTSVVSRARNACGNL